MEHHTCHLNKEKTIKLIEEILNEVVLPKNKINLMIYKSNEVENNEPTFRLGEISDLANIFFKYIFETSPTYIHDLTFPDNIQMFIDRINSCCLLIFYNVGEVRYQGVPTQDNYPDFKGLTSEEAVEKMTTIENKLNILN